MKTKDRKDKIDQVLKWANQLSGTKEPAQAWFRLCRELGHLTHPEARMPRFNALLNAINISATNDQS